MTCRFRPKRFRPFVLVFVLACGGPSRPAEVTLVAQDAAAPSPSHSQAVIDEGPPPVVDGHIAWVAYDRARLALEGHRHRAVFLNFSAEWCAACKADERTALETDAVRTALKRSNTVPMRVDMTDENKETEELLETFGRAGIPLYAIIRPDGTRDLLPQTITAEVVATHLTSR